MIPLRFDVGRRHALNVLCIGAHCDDIEIGCGATILRLASERPLDVTWVVLCSTPARRREAERGAALFLRGAVRRTLAIQEFRDGFLPAQWMAVKQYMETLKQRVPPDLIFTHHRDDRHQDHRVAAELTWNTFRSHLILEYEIPKYDGELPQPNTFVAVGRAIAEKKARYIAKAYPSQMSKTWFSAETLLGLMRLRGVESAAPGGYAEGFVGRKIVL